MGRMSQRKGRAAELELARLLQAHGIPAEPGQAVNYGACPDITGIVGIHAECKRAEALRLPEWMQQAERDAGRFHDGAPVVFFRRSREPWRVVMNLEDWIAIYTDYYRRKEGCNDTQEAKSPGCAADTVNEGESGRYCRNHL